MGAIILQYRNAELLEKVVYSNRQALLDETISGETCKVYSYTSDFGGLIQENKLWVEISSGLPLQAESRFDFSDKLLSGSSSFGYGPSIEINAPIE
jgi:hypothetical protein